MGLFREIAFGGLLLGPPRVAPSPPRDRILSRLSLGAATHSPFDGARRTSHGTLSDHRETSAISRRAAPAGRSSYEQVKLVANMLRASADDAKASVGCGAMAGVLRRGAQRQGRPEDLGPRHRLSRGPRCSRLRLCLPRQTVGNATTRQRYFGAGAVIPLPSSAIPAHHRPWAGPPASIGEPARL